MFHEYTMKYTIFNECSKIIFNENYGLFVKPSNEKHKFSWKVENDTTLLISDKDEENDNGFIRGKYNFFIKQDSLSTKITLKHINQDIIYFLRGDGSGNASNPSNKN